MMNVDALKTEHECDEHWKLRRLFLVAHKNKFEIDRLKCLAQVFINVEILGCRYPQETMDLVNSLASEIPEVQSYREKKKNKLKRTFVQASDAAATRAKGLAVSEKTKKTLKFVPAGSANEPPKKSLKKSRSSTGTQEVLAFQNTMDPPESVVTNPFENIVILENKYSERTANDSFQTVERTFNQYGFPAHELYHCTTSNSIYKCDVVWKGNVVCSANSNTGKIDAKRVAAQKLVKIMKNHCFTVEILKKIESSSVVEASAIQVPSKELVHTPVPEENKGSKMLRMMGWSGGGLGKDGQGIADPVSAVQSVNRSGLGLQKLSARQSLGKIRQCLDQFIDDESAFDLEFAADFTKEERKEIHLFVRKSHMLKSRSHGQDSERRLVVSKVERPCDMVTRLIKAGGSTTKHNLVWPLLSPRPLETKPEEEKWYEDCF